MDCDAETEKPSVAVVILLALGFMVSGSLVIHGPEGGSLDQSRTNAYTPHSVIAIDSDADLVSQAATEGWPGSGAYGDPFVISGYDIDATGYRAGVFLGNISLYLEVVDCYVHDAVDAGIHLLNVANCALRSDQCVQNGWYGIALINSLRNTVYNCSCINLAGLDDVGIYLSSSSGNALLWNNCTSCVSGILMVSSDGNLVDGNTCTDGTYGIRLESSSSNSVTNNTCTSNIESGVCLFDSSDDNTISANGCVANGNGMLVSSSSTNTISQNYVYGNGDPIWGEHGISMLQSNDTLIEANSCLYNMNHGITLDNCLRTTIRLNNCSNNRGWGGMTSQYPGCGINLWRSNDTIIENNTCNRNTGHGLRIWQSDRIVACDNQFCYNMRFGGSITQPASGITGSTSYSSFLRNNCSSNSLSGLDVAGSANFIADSNCSNNVWNGLAFGGSANSVSNCTAAWNAYLDMQASSANSIMRDNRMYGRGLGVSGASESWTTLDCDTTNSLNGKPVQYWRNATGGTVPSGAGQVILANCSEVMVEGQVLNGLRYGLLVAFTSGSMVRLNVIAGCVYGLYLISSDGNTAIDNAIVANTLYGAYLDSTSDNNLIWNNTFTSNNGAGTVYSASHIQAYDEGTGNRWNSSARGNYWSDWVSPDINYDGIVDIPYQIASDKKDFLPLTGQTVVPEFGTLGTVSVVILLGFVICAISNRSRK